MECCFEIVKKTATEKTENNYKLWRGAFCLTVGAKCPQGGVLPHYRNTFIFIAIT